MNSRSISAVLISLAAALTGCGDPYFTAMDAKPAASETPPEETPPPNNGTGGSSAGTSATGGSTATTGGTSSMAGTGNAPSSAGTAGAPSNVPSCVPEEVRTCLCDPTRQQICSDDGLRWSSCGCGTGTPDPGTGGASSSTGGSSGSSGMGGMSAGTGGTSGSGGAAGSSATAGTGGSSGTAGTGGSSAGMGGAGGVATVTLRISFILNESVPAFAFTHRSPDNEKFFWDNQGCRDIGEVRECDIVVDPKLIWQFYASTGLTGPASNLPGKDSTTNRCTAYKRVLLGRVESNRITGVPFSMVDDGNGCVFQIERDGAQPNPGTNDSDRDGEVIGPDCDDLNPSILTGCSAGSGNVHTVRLVAIGSGTGQLWLEPQQGVNNTNIVCQSQVTEDPGNSNAFGTFAVCYATIDRDQDAEFAIAAGSTWATGIPYGGSTDCVRNMRVYAADESSGSLFPAARYDDGGSASDDYEREMTPKYISQEKGCHLILHRM